MSCPVPLSALTDEQYDSVVGLVEAVNEELFALSNPEDPSRGFFEKHPTVEILSKPPDQSVDVQLWTGLALVLQLRPDMPDIDRAIDERRFKGLTIDDIISVDCVRVRTGPSPAKLLAAIEAGRPCSLTEEQLLPVLKLYHRRQSAAQNGGG
jgi:hypothetical protein